jgi:hypothetical protein
VVYCAKGRIVALDCVNSPRDYIRGRKLVLERVMVDPAAATAAPLADLADLLPAAPGAASLPA